MKLAAAFLRMIRLPNLFFIALTQFLFHACILHPVLNPLNFQPVINGWLFILLVAASVFIAAAGYIINDYFDIDIDQVNKPRANVVDTVVSRRWAMAWHFMLSGTGIILSGWISWKTGLWYILIANFICVLLLFAYSVSLKKKIVAGNILIALLTAWTILILLFSELLWPHVRMDDPVKELQNKIARLGFLYAGFAFICTLIREAIKDIEDLQGDEKYGCRTMPVVWGINATKVYVAVWLIVMLALLIILQVYVVRYEWWWPMVYSVVFIIAPFVYILFRLRRARSSKDYHTLSNWMKLVMLAGILSMLFFYFYL